MAAIDEDIAQDARKSGRMGQAFHGLVEVETLSRIELHFVKNLVYLMLRRTTFML